MSRSVYAGVLAVMSQLSACVSADESREDAAMEALGSRRAAIIYGSDDRRDVFEHPLAMWRERVKASSVALIQPRFLQRPPSGRVSMSPATLGERYALCSGERFEEQPASADCSGVLIDRELVLTAGHCFGETMGCDTYAYVFDYFYESEGQLATMSAADVYGCKAVVVRQVSPEHEVNQLDFAIVQLNRPALAPREPVPISRRTLKNGDSVTTLGYPSGLPAKIDGGAVVIDARSSSMDYFKLNSDTFAGSSGSGLFDEQGALVGLLSRGGEDYVATYAGCYVAEWVPEDQDGSPWEHATYARAAIDALCDAGWPSPALCDLEPSCGDGFCTLDEVPGTCPSDCADAKCSRSPCAKSGKPVLVAGAPREERVDDSDEREARNPARCSVQAASAVSASGFLWPLGFLAAVTFRLLRRRTRDI